MSLHKLVHEKLALEHQWANQALSQKKTTDDMKVIDLKVKDIKGEINTQFETDAKVELNIAANKIST